MLAGQIEQLADVSYWSARWAVNPATNVEFRRRLREFDAFVADGLQLAKNHLKIINAAPPDYRLVTDSHERLLIARVWMQLHFSLKSVPRH
jgi:hypothetical protein